MNVLWIFKRVIIFIICILALALLIVFLPLILFVPIRYRLNIDYNKKLYVQAEATWLFRILAIIYDINISPTYELKVFGVSTQRKRKQRKRNSSGKYVDNEEKMSHNKERKGQAASGVIDDEEKSLLKKKPLLKEEKHSFFEGKKHSYTEDEEQPESGWKMFVGYPYKKTFINKTILVLKRLTKAIMPNNIDMECCFGFDDPCLTGLLLGAAHALFSPSRLYKFMYINADFEKKYLYLKCNMDGKIRLWSLLWPSVAYVVCKPVRVFLIPLIFKKK